ncbi:MAG: hypothetical protein EXS05_07050 [Planctomycetaceae bacterium]|nr:hypothetical protein [Planctomycetaceae bacterium]
MNCDTAFDLLTDPHGAASLALESHLAHCPRCRQMQETLSPALEWMRESAADTVSSRDPSSATGGATALHRAPAFATAEALEVANEAAARLSECSKAPAVRYRKWAVKLATCAALIVVGGFLGRAFVSSGGAISPDRGDSSCRRQEAAAAQAGSRSRAEIEALVATCALCHVPDRREGMRLRPGSPMIALAFLDCWDL